jgi:hypothetical protein
MFKYVLFTRLQELAFLNSLSRTSFPELAFQNSISRTRFPELAFQNSLSRTRFPELAFQNSLSRTRFPELVFSLFNYRYFLELASTGMLFILLNHPDKINMDPAMYPLVILVQSAILGSVYWLTSKEIQNSIFKKSN